MNRRSISAAALGLAIIILAAPGFAQTTTGTISGRVLAKDRTPLARASVSAQGPSLQGMSSTLTSASGGFLLAPLPSGVYELRAEVPGYRAELRKGLVVRTGEATTVIIELEPSSAEDEIVTSPPSPMVDVRSSEERTRFAASLLAALPVMPDLDPLQNAVPGAVSEGRPFDRASAIAGSTVRSQLYLLDGGPLSDAITGYPMTNLDTHLFEEVDVVTSGIRADRGPTDGAVISVVTKRGGNSASGSLSMSFINPSLSTNLFPADEAKGLALSPTDRYANWNDYALSLSGPIWEDRAWYAIGGRRLNWKKSNPYAPEARMTGLGFETGEHFDLKRGEWTGFAKLTLAPIDKVRYSGMFHWNNAYEPVDSGSVAPDIAFSATAYRDYENTYATTHHIDYTVDGNTAVEVHGTYVERDTPLLSRDIKKYTYYDNARRIMWGAAPYSLEAASIRMSAGTSLTLFLGGFLGADHEIRFGADYEQGEAHRDWYRDNPYWSFWNDRAKGDPYYVDPLNAIGLLRITPSVGASGIWDVVDGMRRVSAYVQDNLTFGRLSFDLGLRFDYSVGYRPPMNRSFLSYSYNPENMATGIAVDALLTALKAQFRAQDLLSPFDYLSTEYLKSMEYFALAPRLGAAWDILGDGRSVFRLSYARYNQPMSIIMSWAGQVSAPSVVDWNWYDLNLNGLMDLPDTDRYVLVNYLSQDYQSSFFEYVDAAGTKHKAASPYTHELSAGIERELFGDFKVGLSFAYRDTKNLIETIDTVNGYDVNARDSVGLIWLPYSVTDPGRDNLLGTADDRALTVYGLRADRPASVWKAANVPEAQRKYWAATFSFEKRMASRWQAAGSVVLSSLKGNLGTDDASTTGLTSMFNDPNTLTNAYGPLSLDRPLQVRLMGSYLMPFGFTFSAYYQYLSGAPYNRTLSRVYFPENYMGYGTRTPYATVLSETNAGRGPELNLLNLRLEKRFGQVHFLDFTVDVYNVLGSNGFLRDMDPSGVLRSDLAEPTYTVSPTYGQILSIYGVRTFRLGVRYSF